MSNKIDIANIVDDANKHFKKSLGHDAAYLLNEFTDRLTPTDIPGWISTGSDLMDLIISNRPNAGIPMGRITELIGESGGGKSLIGAHMLADTQRQGGVAVYIDTEASVDRNFLRVIGVDLEKMIYFHLETLEQIYEMIEMIIDSIRSKNKDVPVTFLLDSLAGASTATEMESDYGVDGFATAKAKINTKAMRKLTQKIARRKITFVVVNQFRAKLDAMAFGEKYDTAGGMAVKYHMSTRIKLTRIKKLINKTTKEPMGAMIRAEVVKNRVGPPFRKIEFPLYFHSGIDNVGSWLSELKKFNVVGTNSFEYKGEKIKFTSESFSSIINDPVNKEIKEWMYEKICEHKIMKYVTNVDHSNIIDEDGKDIIKDNEENKEVNNTTVDH